MEAGDQGDKEHLHVDVETIERLLREGGWDHHRITGDTWRGHFRGHSGTFPFLVRLLPTDYLMFAIVPFLRTPEDSERAAALYGRLLQLNQVLLMAKFSIDDDLDVVLSVEYPTAHFDKSEFVDALQALSFYADTHYTELEALAAEA